VLGHSEFKYSTEWKHIWICDGPQNSVAISVFHGCCDSYVLDNLESPKWTHFQQQSDWYSGVQNPIFQRSQTCLLKGES
jgi:hypothetical protein